MSFVELLLSLLDTWSKEGEHVLRKARGGDAPYRIRNRTGNSVHVWSDMDDPTNKNAPAVKVTSGETIDWRFDDWKTLREVCDTLCMSKLKMYLTCSMFRRLDTIVLPSNSSGSLGNYATFLSIEKESTLIRFVPRHRKSPQDYYAR